MYRKIGIFEHHLSSNHHTGWTDWVYKCSTNRYKTLTSALKSESTQKCAGFFGGQMFIQRRHSCVIGGSWGCELMAMFD